MGFFIKIVKNPIRNNNLVFAEIAVFCVFLCIFLINFKLNLGLRRIFRLFLICYQKIDNCIIPIERVVCTFFGNKKHIFLLYWDNWKSTIFGFWFVWKKVKKILGSEGFETLDTESPQASVYLFKSTISVIFDDFTDFEGSPTWAGWVKIFKQRWDFRWFSAQCVYTWQDELQKFHKKHKNENVTVLRKITCCKKNIFFNAYCYGFFEHKLFWLILKTQWYLDSRNVLVIWNVQNQCSNRGNENYLPGANEK